jgi:hypothetical protein
MTWVAKAGCAEHHVAVLERLVNSFPPEWLLPPQSGEIFENLEDCNRRLRAFALATGFDIVRKGGGSKALPSWRFFCFYHGTETRNDRKLEARVEADEEGNITSRRQRGSTNVQQLDCQWEGLCSFKFIGKRGSSEKGYVLMIKNSIHTCTFAADPLSVFPAHLKTTEEWKGAAVMAKKHREQVLPYSASRRLIDAESFGLVLSSRAYYNSIRKEIPDKSKPETIEALLLSLEEEGFIYQTRVSAEEDEQGRVTARKLLQIFFAHRKQLEAAQRFVSSWLLVIDGTFNTNKLRLPLLVAVGVLNSGSTFPVAFSYCPSESAESLGFVWQALKEECFVGDLPGPRVILGDWAGGLTASVPKHFPSARFQGCDWHCCQAMVRWYRAKEQDYTSEEVDGSGEKVGQGQELTRRIPGLKTLSWCYIKSMNLSDLKAKQCRRAAWSCPCRDRP